MSDTRNPREGSRSTSLVGSQIEVEIEKMAVGGAGLARHDGLVVFVDFAAPGDKLKVQITEHKKNLAFADIIEILQPGPQRIQPLCQHFGKCGGCSWQHISAEEQLKQKELILRDSLKEILKTRAVDIKPIIPSPRNFQYRNRVQMTFTGQVLAFRGKRSHDLIPIESCELVEESLKSTIKSKNFKTMKSGVRYDLRLKMDDPKPQITALDEDVELVGFSQVNRFQNEDLIQAVVSALKPAAESDLYEFYAGAGNFTFPILKALKWRHVWAVEGSPALVTLAHSQIQTENISNKKLTFHLSDVSQFLRTKWPRPEDVVYLDPPRIGADEFVIKTIAQSKPRQILYLSCHPVTLARDLGRLLSLAPEYNLDFVQPFEMFPQTDHMETLVSLSLTQK